MIFSRQLLYARGLNITLQPTCFQFIIGMCQWLIHLAVWKRVLMRPRSGFSFPYRQILLVRESFSFSRHRLNPSSAQLPYRYMSWVMRGQSGTKLWLLRSGCLVPASPCQGLGWTQLCTHLPSSLCAAPASKRPLLPSRFPCLSPCSQGHPGATP